MASALAARPGARAAFDKLSFTAQRERTEAVTSAKRAETRERRIAKIVAELAGDGLP
ncbi:YdeI/OmpD-associated family protein [Amycolatopsis sp. A1MSW2902]|uniref:YdeI/OmpD-associated family protein n=1 Tax=Amycolatopsis sp. A1MSW2902 TaxID=687413 RepID=UPI00307D5869